MAHHPRRYTYDDDSASTQSLWVVVLVVAAMVFSFLIGKYVIGERLRDNAAEVRNVDENPSGVTPTAAVAVPTTPESTSAVSILSGDQPDEPLTIAQPGTATALDNAVTATTAQPAQPVAEPDAVVAREQTDAERRRADEEARVATAEEARRKAEEQRLKTEAERRKAEAEAKAKADAEAKRRAQEAKEREQAKLKAEAERKKREAEANKPKPETDRPTPTPAPDPTRDKPKPKPADDGAKPLPASSGGAMHRVRAGSYTDAAAAATQQKTLKDKGVDSFVNVRRVNGKTVYDVQVGAFESKDNAKALADQLKQDGVSAEVTD